MKKPFIILITISLLLSGCSNENTIGDIQVYSTKDKCEADANCNCRFAMCDYVPKGKSFEEVCGKNFQEGWQCIK